MIKKNFMFLAAFIAVAIMSLTSCSKDESCLTCTIAGETEDICESDLDEFNRDSGLNAGTLGEVATLIQILGGSCR